MIDEAAIKRESTASRRASFLHFCICICAIICLSAGFLAGIFWERSGYNMQTIRTTAGKILSGSWRTAESEKKERHIDPAQLEARLTDQIRSMYSQIARLQEEAKQGRIQYNLLIERGYSKTNDICVNLVARQTEIVGIIETLRNEAKAAESLRERLVSTINAKGNDKQHGLDDSLHSEVLRVINLKNLQNPKPRIIPDALWGANKGDDHMDAINRQ